MVEYPNKKKSDKKRGTKRSPNLVIKGRAPKKLVKKTKRR